MENRAGAEYRLLLLLPGKRSRALESMCKSGWEPISCSAEAEQCSVLIERLESREEVRYGRG